MHGIFLPILHPVVRIIFFIIIRPTCEMVLWVELKEEEQRKGGEGWEKEIESTKPSPKPSVIYHHLDVYTVYHLTFDICYCARRNVGILINAGAKKAFEHFNVILINLCLSVYGHRGFHFPGKCRYNDRCVNVVRCILDTIYRSFNKQQTFKICLSIRVLIFNTFWYVSFFYNFLYVL